VANDWFNAVATVLVGGLRLVAEDKKCKRPSFTILRKIGAFVSATPKFARFVWSTSSRHSALPAKTYIGSLALYVLCPGFAIRRREPQRHCKATGSGERTQLISE